MISDQTDNLELAPRASSNESSDESLGETSGALSRRDFLRAACLTCCASSAAIWGLGGCAGEESKSPAPASDVLAVQPVENPKGVFLLAKTTKTPAGKALAFLSGAKEPIVVFQTQGKWQALSAKCTHSGCAVDWQPKSAGERFLCPCHASRFDENGQVLSGPAKAPLARYKVRAQGEDLIVTLA